MMFKKRRDTYFVYPIDLPIAYETDSSESAIGAGRILGISKRAAYFASDRELKTGAKIRLAVAWPAILPDGTGFDLSMIGEITRTTGLQIEVTVSQHQFKTRLAAESTPGTGHQLKKPHRVLSQSVAC